MKIAIVDDQKEFLDITKKRIENLDYDIYTYISVYDMDKEGIVFDLVLLDIDMPDCDGIAYSKNHKKKNIIFITSREERMKEAFGSNIYGFIEKSDDDQRYIEVIENAIKEIRSEKYIVLKIDSIDKEFLLKDIIYIQFIAQNYISFVYQNEIYTLRGYTMKQLKEMLFNQFEYIDRATLVNKYKMIKLVDNKLYLKGINQKFIISRRRIQSIRKCIQTIEGE